MTKRTNFRGSPLFREELSEKSEPDLLRSPLPFLRTLRYPNHDDNAARMKRVTFVPAKTQESKEEKPGSHCTPLGVRKRRPEVNELQTPRTPPSSLT